MLRVVVADDEYYARKALIKKITAVGPEVTADFENGAQVAEYLETHELPDLIVTDIRMPVMDGLKLSQYVNGRYPQIKVVIVSGYSDFEYARSAISFGVKDYLLKPVQREKLAETFSRIEAEEVKQKEYISRMVQSQLAIKSAQYLGIEEIAKSGELSDQFLKPVFDEFPNMDYKLVLIQAERGSSQFSIDPFLDPFIRPHQGEWFYFKRFDEYVLLLFDEREELEKGRCLLHLQSFVKKMKEEEGVLVSAGMSGIHTGMHQIRKAYQEAVYAINQRLIQGWMTVYEFHGDINPENLLTRERELVLASAIEKKQFDKAEEAIGRIFDLGCRDIYTMYVSIMGIFNLMYKIYCSGSQEQGETTRDRYLLFSFRTDLYSFHHMKELREYVIQIVKNMCGDPGADGPKHHHIIEEVLDYIDKNYQYDISLNELAVRKYFMNPSYLSRLFKNEVGMTFSKYLIDYRIRKSKELLEGGILKISDVAMLSGYNDVSHYIQAFKKQCGCTPEEYRLSRHGGKNGVYDSE